MAPLLQFNMVTNKRFTKRFHILSLAGVGIANKYMKHIHVDIIAMFDGVVGYLGGDFGVLAESIKT